MMRFAGCDNLAAAIFHITVQDASDYPPERRRRGFRGPA